MDNVDADLSHLELTDSIDDDFGIQQAYGGRHHGPFFMPYLARARQRSNTFSTLPSPRPVPKARRGLDQHSPPPQKAFACRPHRTQLSPTYETDYSLEMRPRTLSMPNKPKQNRPNYLDITQTYKTAEKDVESTDVANQKDDASCVDADEIYRVRTFTTTSKGNILTSGDAFRRRSSSSVSADSGNMSDDFRGRSSSSGSNSRQDSLTDGTSRRSKYAQGPMLEEFRRRTSSGASSGYKLPFRRRTSSSTSRGSHSSGYLSADDFRNRASSNASSCSSGAVFSDVPLTSYKVIVLGAPGTGKSALINQFMTSEYMDGFNFDTETGSQQTVSVLLDGAESLLEFQESEDDRYFDASEEKADAYIVTFSVTDRDSYHHAIDVLYHLREEHHVPEVVMLVGNKTDIVRQRQILVEEGKSTSKTYDCGYIEISAALNHKVDDLLVGTLSNIRNKLKPKGETSRKKSVNKMAKGIINKIQSHLFVKTDEKERYDKSPKHDRSPRHGSSPRHSSSSSPRHGSSSSHQGSPLLHYEASPRHASSSFWERSDDSTPNYDDY